MGQSAHEVVKVENVRVKHDGQRQILEIISLFRVMNNYYGKKTLIQKEIEPLLRKKFKEGLRTLQNGQDWLFSIPTALNTLSDQVFLSSKDSFRFPDSIILFEAWMNLGMKALFPRFVLSFKFPGFLKGEKNRNVFQFIYATSRGLGFPIYLGPEFYGYKLTIGKILEPLFQWSHRVCHVANMGIFALVDKKLNSKRHHPGEFESVIISEFTNGIFKGIDTLLHGYFTNEPKLLGKFNSLEEVLQKITFSYTIGDHAMNIENEIAPKTLRVKYISNEDIVKKYEVNFYMYIKDLLKIVKLLKSKITCYRKKRKELINKLKLTEKIRYRLEQSKNFSFLGQSISKKYGEIERLNHYKHLLEKLLELIWITPLYTHTIHDPKPGAINDKFFDKRDQLQDFEPEASNSILLSFISHYEKKNDFIFEETDVKEELRYLRDQMARMWLYFKERHFKYAVKKLNEITRISLKSGDYNDKILENLEKLIPIISIYEIFNRPLSESVYPEANPYAKSALAVALFKVVTYKYSPIGLNIIRLFNKLSFRNWSYFIKHKKLSKRRFFFLALRLPLWKHIPKEIKEKILKDNSN